MEHAKSSGEGVSPIRGADDQLGALERLWAQGEEADPHAAEQAWQILRRALNETRRNEGARLLFSDE